MIFSCTNPILFLLISGMFSAHSSFVLNMCFNSDRRHTPDGNLFIFNLSHAPLLCDTFYHLTDRWGRLRCLVVVGWKEEGVLRGSQFFVVWGALGCHIGVGSNRLDLPLVPLKMFRVVVWSILCLSQVQILVGSIRLVFLGVSVMGQGWSMRCRFPQICLHSRWGQSVYLYVDPYPTYSPQYYRSFYLTVCRTTWSFSLLIDL